MPAEYLKNRNHYHELGMSWTEAKKKAAIRWNIEHPTNPNPWSREKRKHKKFMAKKKKKCKK